MVGFSRLLDDLVALDATIVAASVDDIDHAREVAENLGFPIGHGVTRADAEILDSWWEDRRAIIQPSEYLLGDDLRVLCSSYSDGPLGRMEAADTVRTIELFEARKKNA